MYFSMAYVAAALGWHVLRLTQSHPKRSLVVVAIRNLRRFTLFNQCCRSSDLPFSPAVSGSRESEPEALSPKPKHNQNTESNDSGRRAGLSTVAGSRDDGVYSFGFMNVYDHNPKP